MGWLVLGASAEAADCEALARRAPTLGSAQVAGAWTDLARCDAAMAEARFEDFMRSTKDVDGLVALAFAAMDAGQHRATSTLLEKVTDYAARDEAARSVGEQCAGHKLQPFLAATYATGKDRAFTSWREAMIRCTSPEVQGWLQGTTETPPPNAIHDKYATVVEAWRRQKKLDALPALEKAAIAAGRNGGPFGTVLDAMTEAVRPEGFGPLPAENQTALEEALVRVARAGDAAHARDVGERLFKSGSEERAATLLSIAWSDRLQGDNTLLYGVASLERCETEAVVHYAGLHEPGTRWNVAGLVDAEARAFKPKLKCGATDWVVVTSPEPVADAAAVAAFAEELASRWATELKVATSTRAEKDLSLP
jgi:hypothetical protein